MKKHFFSLLSVLGLFCTLTAAEQIQNVKVIDLGSHNIPKVDLNNEKEDNVEDILFHSMRSRFRSSSSLTLFQANLSTCNIGIDDRLLLADGGADFVTAFSGNDFACKSLKHGGIEISPANGQSFTTSIPLFFNSILFPGPVEGGLFDHVKFLAYSILRDIPSESHQKLCSTWVGSGEQLHVKNNPFGGAVPHPHSDPRLACVSFTSLAPNLLTTFDWILSNDIIYALVERLPGAEAIFGDYAAYTYMIPVAKRKTKNKSPLKDVHTFQTCFHSNGKTVTWILDGKPVFKITQVGHRLNENNAYIFRKGKAKSLKDPTRFQVASHGGTNQDLTLTEIQTGIALFTLLDFYPPATSLNVTREQRINSGFYEGLVRLESILNRPFTGSFYYNNPLQGGQATFFKDSIFNLVTQKYESTIPAEFRIFGEGAKLHLFDYRLSIEEKSK